MSARHWISLAVAVLLAACNTRDAETDEPAIAADSAAASAPISAPISAPRDTGGTTGGLKTVPGPLDVRPSVPRTGPEAGIMPGPAPDTLRGVIVLLGSDPMPRVALRADPGGPVTLRGAPALATLTGLEVWVAGARRDNGMDVTDFAVRAADGVPAIDGVLEERDGGFSLVRNGRTTAIGRAPAAIRPLIGKRVWVTMANGDVHTFGLIEPPR